MMPRPLLILAGSFLRPWPWISGHCLWPGGPRRCGHRPAVGRRDIAWVQPRAIKIRQAGPLARSGPRCPRRSPPPDDRMSWFGCHVGRRILKKPIICDYHYLNPNRLATRIRSLALAGMDSPGIYILGHEPPFFFVLLTYHLEDTL